MKQFFVLSLLAIFAVSCRGTVENIDNPVNPDKATKAIAFSLPNDVNGVIKSYSILIYQGDDLLASEKGINSTTDNMQFTLPLDESLSVVAVGNGVITNESKYSTLQIGVGSSFDGDVFFSNPVSFKSDGLTSVVNIAMTRRIGAFGFQPKETSDIVSAITAFDKIVATFHNVVTAYCPGAAAADRNIVADVRYDLTPEGNFTHKWINTFPNSAMTFTLQYYKAGVLTKITEKPMPDGGFAIAAAGRLTISYPILDEGYLIAPTRSGSIMTRPASEIDFIYSNF